MKSGLNKILNRALQYRLLWLALVLVVLGQARICAGTPTNWVMGLGPDGGNLGAGIGALPGKHDGWDGGGTLYFWDPGTFLLLYRQHGTAWGGDTGFYDADFEAPIPSGASKTWWDFYLWSDNAIYPSGQIQCGSGFEASVNEGPPTGYMGHLVIDRVAAGVAWTGPMDYWLDLTQQNTFTLPIAMVSDPLQGTRFHLTVYAPAVPEPSSLLLLAGGLILVVARRRRA